MREIDIRRVLLEDMRRIHEPDTPIVEELGLCQGIARVDLAVVNGNVHGYEIKSEHDTLARLPSQTNIYNRTLDFVTIVTAPTHARKIRAVVPKWWGIQVAFQGVDGAKLKEQRKAKPNPSVDPFSVAQFLWRDEALQALTDRGLALGMRCKPRKDMWSRLASELAIEELRRIVRDCIKRRAASWRGPLPPA